MSNDEDAAVLKWARDLTIGALQETLDWNDITRWDYHACSACGFKCYFAFRDGKVFYNRGCYCGGPCEEEERTWTSVLHNIKIQRHASVLRAYRDFLDPQE